jgi:dUTP pyrophosphatase
MGNLYDDMLNKIFKVADQNDEYSLADFDAEFKNVNTTAPNVYKNKLRFEFVNESNNPDPEYATNGSSGFDLRANIGDGNIVIPVGKRAIVPTGLYFNTPENFEVQIRPRSGLAAKNGVTVLNTPGTIDADYRGEIKIILINLGDEDFTITHGDRIAQGIVASVTAKNRLELTRIETLSTNTERGAGGFGSTGRN